jgi:YebC/PmpR family DNA-binding regulatory protein
MPMSGHSKWHNIRVKKTAADKARGKVYTRHARLIEIATRAGGADPDSNSSLRVAIDNAKADNVPNANIDRAIAKGSGEGKGEQMTEIVYAAYGPGSSAYLVECLTDNRNRTLANVKMIMDKNGGNFAESAAVMWMFERKGVVVTKKGTTHMSDDMELALIDLGAENIEVSDETIDVTTGPADWSKVRDYFKQRGGEIVTAGLKFVPSQKAEIKDAETARKVMRLMSALEEDDDVSEVHTNADISPETAAQL